MAAVKFVAECLGNTVAVCRKCYIHPQVLESYLEGKSYQEMARDLGRHVKSIDNALQRVKRKIEKNLAEFEFQ